MTRSSLLALYIVFGFRGGLFLKIQALDFEPKGDADE